MLSGHGLALETGGLEDTQRTLVKGTGTSAERMNHMVLDLLDFARTRFGDHRPIERQELDLREVVEQVVAEVAASTPHRTTTIPESDHHHLGLGLYIVDRIVLAHGGSVDVWSARDKGTTFTVHLPRLG